LGGIRGEEMIAVQLPAEDLAKFIISVRREEGNVRAKQFYKRWRSLKEQQGASATKRSTSDLDEKLRRMVCHFQALGCKKVETMSEKELNVLYVNLRNAAQQDKQNWSNSQYQKARNFVTSEELGSLSSAKAGRSFLSLFLFKNKVHTIELNGVDIGVCVDIEFLLKMAVQKDEFKVFMKAVGDHETINVVKITGDGGKLTGDTTFVLLALQFVENPKKCQSVDNIFPLAIVIEEESAEVIKAMTVRLNEALKNLKESETGISGPDGKYFRFDFHFCFDLKFTWLVEGHEGVRQENGQLCCLCPWPQKCGCNTGAGNWPPRLVGEDGKLRVNLEDVSEWIKTNPCRCSQEACHDNVFQGTNGIVAAVLLFGLDPSKNLWHDIILHGKNRITEKFVKNWIWSVLNPTTLAKKAFAKSRKGMLDKIHAFLDGVGLKKFKVQLEGNSVLFSKQFKGANFSLVVQHFDRFVELFCLSKEEQDTWNAFRVAITLSRVWKEGDGTSKMSTFCITKFEEAVSDFWVKYMRIYSSKHITVYIHLLCWESVILLKRFPNLQRYSQQSMEALIGEVRRNIFHRSGGIGQLIFVKRGKKKGSSSVEDTNIELEESTEAAAPSEIDNPEDEAAEESEGEEEVYSEDGVKVRKVFIEEKKSKIKVNAAFKNCLVQVMHLHLRRLANPVEVERKTRRSTGRSSAGDASALSQLKVFDWDQPLFE
jgi:hypothetical protein